MGRNLTEPRRDALLAEIRRALPYLNPVGDLDSRDQVEAIGRLCGVLRVNVEEVLGAASGPLLPRYEAALRALHEAVRADDRTGGGTTHVDAWIGAHVLDPEPERLLLPRPEDQRRLREHYLARLRDRARRARPDSAASIKLSLSRRHRARLERLSTRLGHATLRQTLEYLIDQAVPEAAP